MKKMIAAALALVLVIAAAVPVFGASGQSLEEAILVVKSIVDITDEMTEFSYSSYERELDNGQTITLWNLNWNDADYNESIYAYVDSLGNLVDYYRYCDSEESGLARVSREQGVQIAEAFMEKALPVGIAGSMRQINEDENKSSNYNLSYTYQFYHNDLPVPAYNAYISVDKYEGYVRSFSGFGEGSRMPVFDNLGPDITLERAQEIFMEQAGVELKYYSNYDYASKTLSVFPAYSLVSLEGCAIDGRTGELVPLYDSTGQILRKSSADSYSGFVSVAAEADEGAVGGGLSEVEQAAVENVAGLISKEAAERTARSAVEALAAGAKLEQASLYQNRRETEKYIWDLNFDEGYVELDAKTSEILNFYIYADSVKTGNRNVSEEQAKKTAEDFLNRVSPGKFKETLLSEDSDSPIEILRKADVESDEFTFRYYRQVNGIEFAGNYFSVRVNKNSGLITSFDSTWYDSVNFPAVDNIITEEAAFEVLNSKAGLMLCYGMTSENTGSKVYLFENLPPYLVDPVTGNKITYAGKPYTETSFVTYGDLEGHWAKSIIEELQQNGYYLEGSDFRPDETITQADFLKYMFADSYWHEDDDDFYKYLQRREIVKDGEKDPNGSLLRKDAAKFAVRYLGLGLAGEQSDIYINSFTDQVESDYLGFAALCQSLGIMQGNKSGAFNGGTAMTRAEAASIIYQLLQVK